MCRLHDFLRGNQDDVSASDVISRTTFGDNPVWYTTINSFYSSISLIYQYMKNQSDDINTLDPSFSYSSWNILECRESDDGGNINPNSPNLKKILRRLRNSVSHGMFELNTSFSEVRDYELTFNDIKSYGDDNLNKNFLLKIKAISLNDFLGRIEQKFKLKYP